jgi:allantoinase
VPDRDLVGYGDTPPQAQWPGGARVALQFVLNVEEGGESSVLNGDAGSEPALHELYGRPARPGSRDPSIESLYEYGSRAGVWRLLRLFQSRALPLTVFAVGRALELNPRLGEALALAGHEVAGHGYRWIDYHGIPEAQEREHIQRTVEIIERRCGRRPVGWYTGRVSLNTRRLLLEQGGFIYDSDAYNDDFPYWHKDWPQHLVVPYTLVNNDFRFLLPTGFPDGQAFYIHLRDAFDLLWNEGESESCPKMMSVGLHGRISGHPARFMGLVRFLDHVLVQGRTWICQREEIARHWLRVHPPPEQTPASEPVRHPWLPNPQEPAPKVLD